MANIAIVIGNATYDNLGNLDCCEADVTAISELLEATGKYETIKSVVNADADAMKSAIRETLESHQDIEELLFYFSGHGVQRQSDFYFCAINFDKTKPNETGLSTTELHTLFRSGDPVTVVKVVDACNSGTTLIKSDESFIGVNKGDLSNIVQISSCLESQFSLTGSPLSQFTESFCKAALRKTQGNVFYTDIIGVIRDEFLEDDNQTPHFVSQGTGRELFVEDASRLAAFRLKFEAEWIESSDEDDGELVESEEDAIASRANMLKVIEDAEQKFASLEMAKDFIDKLFDGIIERVNSNEFTDFFDVLVEEHSKYVEPTAQAFMVRCLSGQKRPDNFVTAYIGQKKKRYPVWESALSRAMYGDEYEPVTTLKLNCSIPRAQMRVIFSPKFKSLDQLRLVISCAPSLTSCYIFENTTKHLRTDWSGFDDEGSQVEKKWYDRKWTEDISWLCDAACDRLLEAVEESIEQASKRLADHDDE
ncbi:caspase domain-containing protein [Sphingomonas sp. IC081]|uniref:caspase family protein n=1 Tax=Sphingomonas sp. IC081 TaxID=304378 RepID=UPI00163CFFC0|nr:caspase family protein [Sphingomonas sp. IC081]